MTAPPIPNVHIEKDSLGIGQVAGAVSASVNKVIDTISLAIGTIYEPTRIKRLANAKAYEQQTLADAKAYEIKALALAQSEAEAQNNSTLALTIESASKRIVAQEVKRQLNLDDIVAKAVEQIQYEKDVSEKTVDPDWTTRFINIAQDVSDEDMKDLWAKILAGEVAQPNSYSLRTLECLKNISKEEANMFITASSLIMQVEKKNCMYNHPDILDKAGLNYENLQRLVEAGLLYPASTSGIGISANCGQFIIIYTDKIALCKKQQKEYNFSIHNMTSVGEQLYKIVSPKYNEQYFMDVLKDIKRHIVSVEYSTIFQKTEDKDVYKYQLPTIKI